MTTTFFMLRILFLRIQFFAQRGFETVIVSLVTILTESASSVCVVLGCFCCVCCCFLKSKRLFMLTRN